LIIMNFEFDFDRFQQELASLGGDNIFNTIVCSSIDSTSSDLKRRLENGAAPGTVVVAQCQTAGRGRSGRTWFSAERGNLYLSTALAITGEAADIVPMVPLAAGVAARDAIFEASSAACVLKWPNDLLIGGKKLAGILSELAFHRQGRSIVIVGIGVNTGAVSFPPDLVNIAVTVPMVTGKSADPSIIAARFVHYLNGWIARIETGERSILMDAWRERAEPFGRRVRVGNLEGVTTDLAPDGRLLIVKDNGEEVSVVGGIIE
jgi:BirA family transcriptional regulator, biotin operon repressor / biotin---[acetyl-CoA-carboxylase] ligase